MERLYAARKLFEDDRGRNSTAITMLAFKHIQSFEFDPARYHILNWMRYIIDMVNNLVLFNKSTGNDSTYPITDRLWFNKVLTVIAEHYPARQAFAGESAWVALVSKFGGAIMNHQTFLNNKGNRNTIESGKDIRDTDYADFDPTSEAQGLYDYLTTQATLIHETIPIDPSLQPLSYNYWNMQTFNKIPFTGQGHINDSAPPDATGSALINRATPSNPWKGKLSKMADDKLRSSTAIGIKHQQRGY